ncbi:type I secretion outer membrane protein, TolC family protein 2 [Achromobacter xylosoxidans A8]|uniref:Type I secretion outer membrane protein, TolC family protein 2 n=1 Tax=Achromobacter xylosoxidans (strain A8) TaxID=762376 RepID=E3HIY5_ACHXA|nr:TolC family outer membrane protein [Achromobacter xylosoxidans]ADP15556.1 type I secretion outer membrane protein, TolC family protein 2 [Achromobacter xylosoxidans A8]
MASFLLKSTTSVLALAFVPAAFAQSSAPASGQAGVTLNQVVEQTLLSNPEIQAKYHDFQASLEGQAVARGAFFPQINAQGYVGREYRNNVPGVGSQSWNRPGYSVELRQLIFDGFRTSNDVKQAGFDKLARFYDLLATSDNTAFSAVQAYVDLQRYRDMELLARQNYTLHEETLKQIGERADSGVGRRVDLEQAGGRLALAQTNLMTETANLLDVQQRFQRVTGALPPDSLQPTPDISGKLPVKPADFNESLRRNPSFLSKQAGLQAAQAGVASSKGAFSPKFEFVAATGRDQNDPTPQNRDIQNSSVQVVMSYNLYRGGADSARVRQTSAQSYAARDIRDYTCRNVQQDLAVAWNNVASLNQKLPFLRDHEVATTKVREAYRQQFQIGQRSLLDLLDTENELFESRRALTNALYDLQIAQYRWLALSHALLPALSLQPARNEMPEENGKLEVSDDVIKLCNSTIPDSARLAPVRVQYNEGNLPPTFIPVNSPKAKP